MDPGSCRIGVALSDELGVTAQPWATIERGNNAETDARLRLALGEVILDEVVVGLPLRLDGSEGGAARHARAFAVLLETEFRVPVELWDERLTTVQAQRELREAGLKGPALKGATDRVAAALMLQSFLDARREPWRDAEG